MEKPLNALNDYLKQWFQSAGIQSGDLQKSMEYSIFGDGKRVRPLLMMTTYLEFREDIERIIPFAAALECIHTYSLIHDDLPAMDDDDYRRGELTNHKVFGEGMAILAGDGLLNTAWEMCIEGTEKLDDHEKVNGLRAMKYISQTAGVTGMIDGQAIDITDYDKSIKLDMYRKKTGGLLASALASGVILATGDDELAGTFYRAGLELGVSYQLQDDAFDLKEDERVETSKHEGEALELIKGAQYYTNSAFDLLNQGEGSYPKVEELFNKILKRDR